MSNNQESKRHHYIPQFILRKFNEENVQGLYYEIETKTLSHRSTKNVFMNMHMYRDEINHEDNPTLIESTLSILEREIAELFNEKFFIGETIEINRRELEKIRIFLGLLSFRCDYRSEQYKKGNFDYETKKILDRYTKDSNYVDLWKREIEELSKMRSFDELKKNDNVDPIIKSDFEQLLTGYYMTVVDTRGGEFLISDVYPTVEICPLTNGSNINLHFFYPISSTRMIVLNHIIFRKEGKNKIEYDKFLGPMKKISKIRDQLIKQPKHIAVNPGSYSKDDRYIYKPQRIYADDIKYINKLFLNEARIGILFQNKTKVIDSVNAYTEEKNTKNDYIVLAKQLMEDNK